MAKWADTAEKATQLVLGVAKLAVGGPLIDAASDVFSLIAEGRDLFSDLSGEEELTLAKRIMERAEAEFEALAANPNWPPEERRDAIIHFEQAIVLARPTPEAFARAALDPARMADELLQAVLAKGGPVALAMSETSASRRLFVRVTRRGLEAALSTPGFIETIAPDLWSTALSGLRDMQARTRRIEAETGDIKSMLVELHEQHGVALRALQAIYLSFKAEKASVVLAMSAAEIADAILPRIEEFSASQQKLATQDDEKEIFSRLKAEAAALNDEGRFEEAHARLTRLGSLKADAARAAATEARRLATEASEAHAEAADAALRAMNFTRFEASMEAAMELARDDPELLIRHQNKRALALHIIGEQVGSVDAVRRSIDLFLEIDAKLRAADAPKVRLAELNEALGDALITMSRLRPEPVWLEQAHLSLRSALEFRKSGDDPIAYAHGCLRLAKVVHKLGESWNDASFFDVARQGFETAIEIGRAQGDEELVTLATADLGATYFRIGDEASLDKAVELYDEALSRIDPKQRVRRASVKMNKASALAAYNAKSDDDAKSMAYLHAADGIYREIGEVFTEAATPVDWAENRHNHSGVLIALAGRTKKPELADRAAVICRETIEWFGARSLDRHKAMAETRLGDAIRMGDALRRR